MNSETSQEFIKGKINTEGSVPLDFNTSMLLVEEMACSEGFEPNCMSDSRTSLLQIGCDPFSSIGYTNISTTKICL